MSSQIRCGMGSVAIIELFIGSQRRLSPGSLAVNPSVARNTIGARTVPHGVATPPGPISVAGERSYRSTPRRCTVSASPRASEAGWIRAQCGLW